MLKRMLNSALKLISRSKQQSEHANVPWLFRPRNALKLIPSHPSPVDLNSLSREQLQAIVPSLLPEIVREMASQMTSNPELTRALRAALLGPILPFVSGVCGTLAKDVGGASTSDRTFGSVGCNTNGSDYSFPSTLGVGLSSLLGNVKLQASGTVAATASGLGSFLIEQTGNPLFLQGVGFNWYWNGSNWVTAYDGANSAGSLILTNQGDGAVRIYTIPTDTNAAQSVSNANLPNYERMRITSGGDVGIGTTSPNKKLEIWTANGTESGFRISQNVQNAWDIKNPASTSRLDFADISGTYLTLVNGGNIGIGTSTPQKTLTLAPSKMASFEIATPGTPTVAATTVTGGSLSGTYFYKVAALDSSGGETAAGPESSSVSLSSGAMVSWATVAGASNYRVYRKLSGGSYDKYILVPATTGGTQAFPDTGATLAGSGTPPSSGNTFAIAAVVGSSTGSLTTTNPYWYTISALDSGNSVLAVSPESSAVKLTTGQNSVLVTWSQYSPGGSVAKYRIYRATLVGGVKTYSSGYYEVLVATSLGNSIALADTGNGAATDSPENVTTAYIVKTGDNQIVSSVGSPANVRCVEQLLPGVQQASQSDVYSTGLYLKVDLQNQQAQTFGIYGDLKNQPDQYGGFCKVDHAGRGDAFYVALLGSEKGTGGNVAFEAATYVDTNAEFGSKGIISTNQASSPNAANVLFTALWDNTQVPSYGMFYAQKSVGNALLIEKRSSGASDGQQQIRITESGVGRERFEVYNDGAIRISSPAVSGSPQNSPQLRMRGTDASNSHEIRLSNVVTSSNSRLSIQDESDVEKVAATSDGQLWVKAHSGYADSQAIFTTGSVTTTNSTVTTLAVITLTDGRAYQISVRVIGRKSDGTDRAFYWRAALAYRQGGNAQIEGGSPAGVVSLATVESSGAGGWDATLDASGNDVRVRVTGQTSTTIYWTVTIEYQSVATST